VSAILHPLTFPPNAQATERRRAHARSDLWFALALSLAAHAAIAAWFRPAATELPQLPAFNRVEVSLYAPPMPKVSRPKEQPTPPTPRTTEPAMRQATDTAPVQAQQPSADKDEPLVEARFNVNTLNNPKPPYPLAARRRGQQGRVLLTVQVRADGSCGTVGLKKTSGYELLDESALKTVRDWRFIPARRGDTAVESWVDVPVTFRLEDAV
jgi:periplasmic protein TonB